MKYMFVSWLLIFTFSFKTLCAQHSHFIYFQTENKQSFYVKVDSKLYPSNASGYLIVPGLKAGQHTLAVGFPKNEWPEQSIDYNLDRDAGYMLKNFTGKGWGLEDLQSSDVIMGSGSNEKSKNVVHDVTNDEFSNMLATVVNDSTIKQKDLPVEAKDKNADAVSNAGTVAAQEQADNPKNVETAIVRTVITKKLQTKGKDGWEMIYTDEYNNGKDTVRIFMPVEGSVKKDEIVPEKVPVKPGDNGTTENPAKQEDLIQPQNQGEAKTNNEQASVTSKPVSIADASQSGDSLQSARAPVNEDREVGGKGKSPEMSPATDSSTGDLGKIDGSRRNKKKKKSAGTEIVTVSADEVQKKESITFIEPAEVKKSKCKETASENDFFRLRKKMAAEGTDEDMITVAKKVFKSKCFATESIKNLATLFLKDEGKYNFFDAAYPYVYDPGTFSSLENQLTDDYYIKRFKVMIRQ